MAKDHSCAATMDNNLHDDVGVHADKSHDGVDGVPFETTSVGAVVLEELEASCAINVGTSTSPRFDATPGRDGMWEMRSIDFSIGDSECFIVIVFVLKNVCWNHVAMSFV